jgi:hypothetical protein
MHRSKWHVYSTTSSANANKFCDIAKAATGSRIQGAHLHSSRLVTK